MSKILIIGNSLAAVSAIEEIRKTDSSSEITLICPEGVLPYDRQRLAALVSRELKESQIYPYPQQFFQEQKVQVIFNEQIARISTKRKHITTENKTQISYDRLLLTDLGAVKLPPIKGHHKEGVFDAVSLTSIRDMVKYLLYVDNIVMPVTNFLGFNLACALSRMKKEVLIVTPTNGILPEIFDEETAALLRQIIEAKGIRVAMNNHIEEILGDTQVKAVRLKSGKVMAAEAVVIDAAYPDLKLLAESGLTEIERIKADAHLTTALPEILAADAVLGRYDLLWEELAAQGRCAGNNILKAGSAEYKTPVAVRNFGDKICDGFCGGVLCLPEGGSEHMKFEGPENIYKKVFISQNRLAGVVWFNAMAEKEKVFEALVHQKEIKKVEDL